MTDPELDIIASDPPDLDDHDLAFAVSAVGTIVALLAGIAVWLGPTVLTWIAVTAAGVALGAGLRLAVNRCFNQRSNQND